MNGKGNVGAEEEEIAIQTINITRLEKKDLSFELKVLKHSDDNTNSQTYLNINQRKSCN